MPRTTKTTRSTSSQQPRAPRIRDRANKVLVVPPGTYSTDVGGQRYELVAPTEFPLNQVTTSRRFYYVTTPEDVMLIVPVEVAQVLTLSADRRVVIDTA